MDYRTASNFYRSAVAVLAMAREPGVIAAAEARVTRCLANLIGAASA
jgi:hypothetical protein